MVHGFEKLNLFVRTVELARISKLSRRSDWSKISLIPCKKSLYNFIGTYLECVVSIASDIRTWISGSNWIAVYEKVTFRAAATQRLSIESSLSNSGRWFNSPSCRSTVPEKHVFFNTFDFYKRK